MSLTTASIWVDASGAPYTVIPLSSLCFMDPSILVWKTAAANRPFMAVRIHHCRTGRREVDANTASSAVASRFQHPLTAWSCRRSIRTDHHVLVSRSVYHYLHCRNGSTGRGFTTKGKKTTRDDPSITSFSYYPLLVQPHLAIVCFRFGLLHGCFGLLQSSLQLLDACAGH